MAAQVSADESLWEVIEEKAQNGTMTAVEHLLYTTLRSTQAKLAESEKQNEDLEAQIGASGAVVDEPQLQLGLGAEPGDGAASQHGSLEGEPQQEQQI